jgi:hypothetical protein
LEGYKALVLGLGVGENAGKAVRVQCKGNDNELEVRLKDRKQLAVKIEYQVYRKRRESCKRRARLDEATNLPEKCFICRRYFGRLEIASVECKNFHPKRKALPLHNPALCT